MAETKSILSKFTDLCIAIFLVCVVGFYYKDYTPIIWFGYSSLGVAVFVNILFKRVETNYTVKFIICAIGFALLAYISVIWAYNGKVVLEQFNILIKVIIVTCGFILLLNSTKKIEFSLYWLSIGAIIYGFIYLQNVTIADLGASRFRSENADMPNYNLVSMYLAFAAVYLIGRIIAKKDKNNIMRIITVVLMIAAVIMVFILSSRKSILMVILGFLCFLFGKEVSTGSRIKLVGFAVIALLGALAILPEQYVNYTIGRFAGLNNLGSGTVDVGDEGRVKLIEYGVQFFFESPIFGHGFFNFSPLFQSHTGEFVYAHNNYLETLTDLGIIGLIILYYPAVLPLAKGWKIRNNNILVKTLLILGVVNLFDGFFIVTYMDRVTWLLVAIIYMGIFLEIKNYNKIKFSWKKQSHSSRIL